MILRTGPSESSEANEPEMILYLTESNSGTISLRAKVEEVGGGVLLFNLYIKDGKLTAERIGAISATSLRHYIHTSNDGRITLENES
jgi:hypothetical protein